MKRLLSLGLLAAIMTACSGTALEPDSPHQLAAQEQRITNEVCDKGSVVFGMRENNDYQSQVYFSFYEVAFGYAFQNGKYNCVRNAGAYAAFVDSNLDANYPDVVVVDADLYTDPVSSPAYLHNITHPWWESEGWAPVPKLLVIGDDLSDKERLESYGAEITSFITFDELEAPEWGMYNQIVSDKFIPWAFDPYLPVSYNP